ncbi:hypothetical protein Ddye_029829 [Dipteronia dyeriana]|uniref:RNase H type-1 domain-containing protein n=1 Tax=Dipteronia dyeriana TaxID=168575 RepID=A0AAD9TFU8_9ROSI|nr:hypothetical protein Ddye_029829 [Dipteronia dyeriana]
MQVWNQIVFGELIDFFKGLPALDVLRGIFPTVNRTDSGTQHATSSSDPLSRTPPQTGRCPAPSGTLKLNSNVAIRDGFPFIGFVIRGHKWDIIDVVSKPLQGSFCAEVGEFLALREGLLLAKRSNLIVELAEVDVVSVDIGVNSFVTVNNAANFIVNDIKALLKEVGGCMCHAISRVGNTLAHDLASVLLL